MNWYMRIGDSRSEQLLYNVEKPRGGFRWGDKRPTYQPITIELPIRTMPDVVSWLDGSDARDLTFLLKSGDSDPVDNFKLERAKKLDQRITKSRYMDAKILSVTIKYEGVQDAFI